MRKKWLVPTILVIGVFLLVTATIPKKESTYAFRCSEDKTSIEIYNLNTGGFDTWQNCQSKCETINGLPTCEAATKQAETPQKNSTAIIVLAGLVALYMIKTKEEKND